MTYFEGDEEHRKNRGNSGMKIGAAVAGLFALIGAYKYITAQDFLDHGHVYVALFFLLSLSGIFLSFKNNKMLLGVIFTLLAATSIFVITKKIDWQKAYDAQLRSTAPFMFYSYVERYPTWEEYTFATIFKKPDWVRFTNECARPALDDKSPGPSCKTLEGIENKYYIDMRSVLADYLKRMQNAAKSIDRGKIKNPRGYQNCINRRSCAEIPLLPDGVSAESISPSSEAYLEIRRPFWQLVNEKEITPEICDFMLLCHALEKTGAVNFER